MKDNRCAKHINAIKRKNDLSKHKSLLKIIANGTH